MGATQTSKIQKVSLDDVKMARQGADFSAEKVSADKANNHSKTPDKSFSYVAKLTNSEISKFFSLYGYIDHEKFKDQSGKDFVRVSCENFDVIFSDYDIAVNCFPEFASTTSKFNFAEFMKYCKSVDISPEQAIADIITTDLLTARFPSYAESRNTYKDEQATNAFVSLPKNMKFLVRSLHEKTMAINKLEGNKGRFGTFDAETYKSARFGEGNNQ